MNRLRLAQLCLILSPLVSIAEGGAAQREAAAGSALEIEGLLAGETARALAPAAAIEDPSTRRAGRVVDAFTGLPLADVLVESWTEEIDVLQAGFRQIGRTRTGVDGRYTVRHQEGGRPGDKWRFSREGYATRSTTDPDDVIALFPIEEHAPRLRIVDLEGRPIAGALVTSTYSCAHDLPAFELVSDALGFVALPRLALQDEIPELRVRAAGYRARKYVGAEQALALAERGEAQPVPLGRMPGAEVELLDDAGQPLAHQSFHVLDGDGYHLVRSDAAGRLRIESRYGLGELLVQRLADGKQTYVGALHVPPDGFARLRGDGDARDSVTDLVPLTIDFGRAPDERAPFALRIAHVAGYGARIRVEDDESGGLADLPPGELRFWFESRGGRFIDVDGRLQHEQEVAGTLAAHPPAGVRLALDLPALDEDEGFELWVQCLGQTMDDVGEVVEVPAGSEVVACLSSNRRLCATRVDAAAAGDRLDLSGAVHELARWRNGAIVSVSVATAGAQVRLRETVQVAEYGGVELVRARVGPSSDEVGADAASTDEGSPDAMRPTEFELVGPADARALLRWERAGHATVWSRHTLGAAHRIEAPSAPRLASLELVRSDGSPSSWEIEGLEPDALPRLHPGPLELVLRAPTRERLGLSLRLAPGEARRLVLPEPASVGSR